MYPKEEQLKDLETDVKDYRKSLDDDFATLEQAIKDVDSGKLRLAVAELALHNFKKNNNL